VIGLTLQIDQQEIEDVKNDLNSAKQRVHLVIFQTNYSIDTKPSMHLITDYQTFINAKNKFNESDLQIVRDILPVTDNLACWAIVQHKLVSKDYEDKFEVIKQLEFFTNKVLLENKLPVNGPDF
jgi:hypothetical protein